MTIENKQKSDKIFKRLCKEIGIYPGKFYKHIMNFFSEHDTYVFYGLDDASYSSYDESVEIKFYKLQLDLAKRLIEEGILIRKDYQKILNDTLLRYDTKKSNRFLDKWDDVSRKSGKREFVDFFIPQYEKKIIWLSDKEKERIYSTLPM